MNISKYYPVIGLEVHVELKTKSKMFCGCSADYFGHKPNTHTCPVCLGLPGSLPAPNKKAIEWCVMIGIALNCEIPLISKFDRKNYFYPDLPKGYQITQYDEPFAINGHIDLKSQINTNNQNLKRIRIRRVHMEEDTGKLLHATVHGGKVTLIDFNRSGVPLVEIVTEPDFESALEVKEYLQKLQQIVRFLGVSDADMEKGQMRLEPNISLRENITNNPILPISIRQLTDKLPEYKVEIKNINSFRFVERAIQYEIERQTKILQEGKTPIQETRGWDEKKGITVSQRAKEEAMDYRYFPEPDIPPIRWEKYQISNIKYQISELPDVRLEKLKKQYQLSEYDAEILTRERVLSDYFEEAVKVGEKHNVSPKQIANAIINKKYDIEKILPAELIQHILKSFATISVREEEIEKIIKTVLDENQKAAEDYKKGKESAIMFLIGQVMRKIGKKIDAKIVREKIETKLKIL